MRSGGTGSDLINRSFFIGHNFDQPFVISALNSNAIGFYSSEIMVTGIFSLLCADNLRTFARKLATFCLNFSLVD
jgi:hypothetical protein